MKIKFTLGLLDIQMLIEQALLLIEDLLLAIVFPQK